ncbi:MAG: hypothetical protein RJB38_1725, partial [Pseudomonadota bacterium]
FCSAVDRGNGVRDGGVESRISAEVGSDNGANTPGGSQAIPGAQVGASRSNLNRDRISIRILPRTIRDSPAQMRIPLPARGSSSQADAGHRVGARRRRLVLPSEKRPKART